MTTNTDSVYYRTYMEGAVFTSIEEKSLREIRAIIEKVGLNPNLIDPKIIERLSILNKNSQIFEDESRSLHHAERLFEFYKQSAQEKNLKPFSPEEERSILIGTLFSDIGKTGPADVSRQTTECISTIFSSDYHPGKPISTKEFLEHEISDPEKIKTYTTLLTREAKIDVEKSVGYFFSQHVAWTYDLLTKYGQGIPKDAVTAAASHHFLEKQNPANVTSLPRATKVIILLDQYDAHMRRHDQTTHTDTIEWLKQKIEDTALPEDKPEFIEIIKYLSSILSDEDYKNVKRVKGNNAFKPLTNPTS